MEAEQAAQGRLWLAGFRVDTADTADRGGFQRS